MKRREAAEASRVLVMTGHRTKLRISVFGEGQQLRIRKFIVTGVWRVGRRGTDSSLGYQLVNC